MFFGKSKSKSGPCGYCGWISVVIAFIAFLAVVATLIGVVQTLVVMGMDGFSSAGASLGFVALALNLFLFKKTVSVCCCECTLPPSGKK